MDPAVHRESFRLPVDDELPALHLAAGGITQAFVVDQLRRVLWPAVAGGAIPGGNNLHAARVDPPNHPPNRA